MLLDVMVGEPFMLEQHNSNKQHLRSNNTITTQYNNNNNTQECISQALGWW